MIEINSRHGSVQPQRGSGSATEVCTRLIQELITDGFHRVTYYKPECDKIMRLHAQTALIENGFVHLPETAPWLAEYLHEMTVFPKGNICDDRTLIYAGRY
jgi:predicted phage terminase large subunit-like protein